MTRDQKKDASFLNSNPRPSRSTRGTRIKRLGIVYEERHRTHIIRFLAEMYKPSEVAALMIQEYHDEWKIEDSNTLDAIERIEKVRAWVFERARFYSYAKERVKVQNQIRAMREEIRSDLEAHYRDANKFARIADLAKIKELAMKDHQYTAAVKALVALREELEGTKLRIDGTINHNHRVITPESEIDAQLTEILTEIGVERDRAHSFVRSIAASPGARPYPAQAEPRQVETGPRQLHGRAPRGAKGNTPMEQSPGVQKP